jgi:hypothetical protein
MTQSLEKTKDHKLLILLFRKVSFRTPSLKSSSGVGEWRAAMFLLGVFFLNEGVGYAESYKKDLTSFAMAL